MSLLGSIFGSSKGGDDNSNIFEKSSELPERPNHEPIVVKRKESKKKKFTEESEDSKPASKKRRKSKSKDDEDINDEEGANGGNGEAEQEDNTKNNDERRTVFVGNLPVGTTRKALASLFKDCGQLESTRIRSVPVKGLKLPQNQKGNQNLMKKVSSNLNQIDDESWKDTCQGYVVFKETESVDKAIAKNNSKVKICGGRHIIRVDRASPTIDHSRSVFVGNLPYGASESTLQAHFTKGCDLDVTDIEGVRIVRDKDTFQCKGFGYVLFKEKATVSIALKLHDTAYLKRSIRVQVCGKRFKSKAKPVKAQKESDEQMSAGAFRRILAKQTKEAVNDKHKDNKRKRGSTKKKDKTPAGKKSQASNGLSKRAALDKKVDQRVRKLQKRMTKGMGKTRVRK